MKIQKLSLNSPFKVGIGNSHSQVAEMVIKPGGREGGMDNRHKGADQWMYIVSGKGTAIVNGERVTLAKSTLLLIERNETHEIINTGKTPLKTINIYVPPAYTPSGNERPAGKK